MMIQTTIGKYRDKLVKTYCESVDEPHISHGALKHATTLICIGYEYLTDSQIEKLVEGLSLSQSLSYVFYGANSTQIVDRLMQRLDREAHESFTFVFSSNGTSLKDAVEQFILHGWPPQERWDEWLEYLFIHVCENFTNSLNDAVSEVLREVE